MNQMRRKSPFWSLAAPILIYMGVRLAVEVVGILVISFPYLMDASEQLLAQQQTVEQFTQQYWALMEPAMNQVFRYSTEIAGAAALVTIPVNAVFFSRDRKLERVCGVEVPERAPLRKYWAVVVFGLAVSIAATCFFAMVELAFYSGESQSSTLITYTPPFAVQLLVLGIVVPVAEELMFRGVLFRRFLENRSFWYAAVWSLPVFRSDAPGWGADGLCDAAGAFPLLCISEIWFFESAGCSSCNCELQFSDLYRSRGVQMDWGSTGTNGRSSYYRSIYLFCDVCADSENRRACTERKRV